MITTTCDICGKNLAGENFYRCEADTQIYRGNGNPLYMEMDICMNCFQKMLDAVRKEDE